MTARARGALGMAIMVALVVGWVVFLRPASLGGPTSWIVIRGSSMLPAYHNGDLVIVRSSSAYGVGDSVAYRVPEGEIGAGKVVIHRIIGGDGDAGFELQGDNNSAPDPWRPTLHDVVGREWVVVPGLGRLIGWILQPVVAGGLASALVVAYIVARPGSGPGRTERPAPLPDGARSFARPANRRAGRWGWLG